MSASENLLVFEDPRFEEALVRFDEARGEARRLAARELDRVEAEIREELRRKHDGRRA